jgi:hypothetical protein
MEKETETLDVPNLEISHQSLNFSFVNDLKKLIK